MASPFNANDYGSVPTLNAALTVALTRRLIVEMPKAIAEQPLTAVAAERMRTRAIALRGERLKQLEQPAKVDTRPFDNGEDNAWRAVSERILSLARLKGEVGARAAALHERLFPEGLGFLNLEFAQQWEQSERVLQLVDKQALGQELDELCGSPAFREELLAAHQSYGDALGLTKKRPSSDAPAVSSALVALREAIRFYSRRVAALADEEDSASIQLVQEALMPIDTAQKEARQRRAKGEPEPEPEDEGELPPLPAG